MQSYGSLIELLRIGDDSDLPAVITSSSVVSRAEIVESAQEIAGSLDRWAPAAGRIGLVESRSHHDLAGIIGGWLAGRSVAMLPSGDDATLRRLAVDSGCRVVLQAGEPTIIEPRSTPNPRLEPGLGTEALGSAEAVVLYTSGTTSKPRGVRLSERNVLSNLTAMLRLAIDWSPADHYGQVLSISHSFGLSMALLAFIRAVPTVVLDDGPPSRRLVGAMEDHGISVFACVPYSLRLLARRGVRLGLESSPTLRAIYLAGGGMSDNEVMELLPDFEGGLYLMYGLTECTARVAVRRRGDGAPSGTVGLPLPGTFVDVVDDDGLVVPVGTPGLVRVVSPSRMIGYLGESPLAVDAPFATTDLGVLDAAGHLQITGRRAEMLNFRGNRVSLLAIEALVGQTPGIIDALFRPDDATEDAQCVVAVVAEEASDHAGIKREILRRVHPRGLIRQIQFVDAVPRTRSGKPIRR